MMYSGTAHLVCNHWMPPEQKQSKLLAVAEQALHCSSSRSLYAARMTAASGCVTGRTSDCFALIVRAGALLGRITAVLYCTS
jgi:hypothetical protein